MCVKKKFSDFFSLNFHSIDIPNQIDGNVILWAPILIGELVGHRECLNVFERRKKWHFDLRTSDAKLMKLKCTWLDLFIHI